MTSPRHPFGALEDRIVKVQSHVSYLLVFLHLGTRRCWISPCTQIPDSVWVSQQAKNFLMEAEGMDVAPKMVMRDSRCR